MVPLSHLKIEMVFALDTTGSMGGLIAGAKERIWGIINEVQSRKSQPLVKVGLVAYRDHGDAYVTKIIPLSYNLDKVYTQLMDFQADGGGDRPEDVRRALNDAVLKSGWAPSSQQMIQAIFLVGDSPPHFDYKDEPSLDDIIGNAQKRGIILNTIECGDASDTRQVWQHISSTSGGEFHEIVQDGGVQVITTPYDAELASLASHLGATYLPYGGGGGASGERFRESAGAALAACEFKVTSAPIGAQAERAINKSVNSLAYTGDLLQSIENGATTLDRVPVSNLPAQLQRLTPAQRQSRIHELLQYRQKIRDRINKLARQRASYIASARARHPSCPLSGRDGAGFAAMAAPAMPGSPAGGGYRHGAVLAPAPSTPASVPASTPAAGFDTAIADSILKAAQKKGIR
jgi:hypothetical protein